MVGFLDISCVVCLVVVRCVLCYKEVYDRVFLKRDECYNYIRGCLRVFVYGMWVWGMEC